MKRRWLDRAVVGGLTTGAALVLAAGPAAAAGSDNVVNVSDTQGQPPAFRASVQVGYDPGPDVSNQNVAIARSSSCTGCRAFATALQLVIIEGSPSDVQPDNAASASNSGCDGCRSFAYANQFFIQTDGPVHLSPGAESQLNDIQAQMDRDLTDAGASTDPGWYGNLGSQLDSLAAQAEQLVENDLVASGHRASASTGAKQVAEG